VSEGATAAARAGARIAARLLTAALAVSLAGALTWIVGHTLVLGWIGLGLTLLSLPVGPSLAVAATHRLFEPSSGPRSLPVTLGTWAGAAITLTMYAFVRVQQPPWGQVGAVAAVAAGSLVGASIGALLRPRGADLS